MSEQIERIRVLTFPELQAKRRKKSIVLFLILSLYYIFSFLFLFWVVKLIGFRILTKIPEIPLLLSYEQVLMVSLFAIFMAGIHWVFSIVGGLNRIESALQVKPLDPEDRYHRLFQNVVEEMMISSGVRNVKPVVLPSYSVNAFAAGDMKGKALIGVTEGLLARLDRTQLEGVVGHEMAHIAEGDHVINTIVCSLFAVFANRIEMSQSLVQEGVKVSYKSQRFTVPGRYLAYPLAGVIWMLAVWIVRLGGLLLKMAVSREREHLADATAVQLTRNPLGLAEALYKISRSWKGSGFVSEDLDPLFFVNPEEKLLDEKEGWFADLFSTHPPIRKRILSLVNQARMPLSSLKQKIEKEEVAREAAKEKDMVPRWMVNRDGNWEGPFGMRELAGFPWFTPQTWISQEGKEEIFQASGDPLLSGLFQSRIPSSSPLSQSSEEGKSIRCPRCKQVLIQMDYEGVYLLRCFYCGGSLVKTERFPRILSREEKGFTPEQKKWADRWESKMQNRPDLPGGEVDPHLLCPKCQGKMIRNFYSYQYFIPVDRCLRCQWTWFDTEELSLLQMLVEKHRSQETFSQP